MRLPFTDRKEAGEELAAALDGRGLTRPIVLALPRGGLPVGAPVAERLGGVLDVLVTRKIGYPLQPELGVGAIAEGGAPVFDARLMARLGLRREDLAGVVKGERAELRRRVEAYRGDRPLPDLAGRDVVIVDDGLATGNTARAALRAVRTAGPGRLLFAAPVGAADTAASMRAEADDVVVLVTPAGFQAVGQWYARFDQLSDDDVLGFLGRHRPGA